MTALKITYLNKEFIISKTMQIFKIGRSELNDLTLDNPTISAYHGQIYYHDKQFIYEDLKSRNGTLILDSNDNRQIANNKTVVLSGTGTIIFGSNLGPQVKFSIDQDKLLADNITDESGSESLFNEGIASLNTYNFKKAIEKFEESIEKFPEDIDRYDCTAYYCSGFSAWKLNKFDDAILRFEQHLMIKPEDSDVMTDLGKIYEKVGKIQKAREWYHRAIRSGNESHEAKECLNDLPRFKGYGTTPSKKYRTIDILSCEKSSVHRAPHFDVSYFYDHLEILKEILKKLEISYENIGKFLNFYPAKHIKVDLVPNRSEPYGITNSKGIVFYLSSAYVGEQKFLSVLVRHEYSHYALGLLTKFSKRVPWWFHEGFAQFMSQSITKDRLLQIKGLVDKGKLLPLDALQPGMEGIKNRNRESIAYLVSHAAVTYFSNEHGPVKMLELIKALPETEKIAMAFNKVQLDYFQFQENFHQWLIKTSKSGQIKLTQKLY